jgi:hypothetical protein
MYHPGKVLEIFNSKDKSISSADESTQATLDMWDENIITFSVAPKIAGKIKKGDIALVDYRPVSDSIAIPKHIIIKILSGNKGKEIWSIYKDYLKKKKIEVGKELKIKPRGKQAAPSLQTFAG